MNQRPSIKAYSILMGAQSAVGAAAIFARYALHGTGPIGVAALRLTIAAVPILIFSIIKNRALVISKKHEILFACAGVALALHFGTWIASLLYTSVAVSTLLVCTTPVWTVLYDTVILKKPTTKAFWLAFAAAALGTAMVVGTKSGAPPVPGFELGGDLLAIFGGAVFSVYLILVRSVSHEYPTTVIVGRTYSWTALFLALAALLMHQYPPQNDMLSWGGILAMAIISQMLGHTGINASLRWFTPSAVAFSTLLEPVMAAVSAAIFLSELLSAQVLIGSAIILAALAVILKVEPDDITEQIAREGNEL